MNGGRFIQYDVIDEKKQLIVAPAETSRQGKIAGLIDDTFAHHLPEFFLRDPEFFSIITNNLRIFLGCHNQDNS